jgi:hypothetical protein
MHESERCTEPKDSQNQRMHRTERCTKMLPAFFGSVPFSVPCVFQWCIIRMHRCILRKIYNSGTCLKSMRFWNPQRISKIQKLPKVNPCFGDSTLLKSVHVWNSCVFEIRACLNSVRVRNLSVFEFRSCLKSVCVWTLCVFEIHACSNYVHVWNPWVFKIRACLKSVRVWNPCVFEIRACLKSANCQNLEFGPFCVFEIRCGFQKRTDFKPVREL